MTHICEARRTAPAAVEMVRRLGPTTDNATLAKELNAAGHVTGTGRKFDTDAVRILRRSYGIPPAGLLAPSETTVADVSNRLGITRNTVIDWIEADVLTARRDPTGRYLIVFTPDAEATCRARIANSRQIHRDPDGHREPGPHERSPAQVAQHLGLNRDTIYNWIRRGYLPTRHGPGGRTLVSFTSDVETQCRQRIADSAHLPPAVKAQAPQGQTGDAL
jgi:predicted DNA-binding transcriptional regulator AlpA